MKTRRFTLIEILFAVMILAMAMGVTLAISAQAKSELIRAQQRWLVQHSIEQATEFCLVANPRDLAVPENLLPEGFSASCYLDVVEDGLPDYAVEPYRGWVLGVYTIVITDDTGEERARQTVHKLVPEDAVL